MSTSNGAVEVIAIFGPTASGKSAVAEAVADELGTEVVSADAMQVYRGLPILTNQPSRPTRLVAIRSLAEEMSVGAYASLAHEAIDELVATARKRRRRRRNRALSARGARRSRRSAARCARGARPGRAGGRRGSRRRARATRVARSRRGGRRAPERPPAARARARARGGGRLADAQDRTGSGAPRRGDRRSSSASICPARSSSGRIRLRAEEMFERGVVDEVRAALDGQVSRTAEKTLGLREIAELEPRRGARTHRHPDASLRRVPAEVDATDPGHRARRRRPRPGHGGAGRDRPFGRVASGDAVREVARARERVPAHRAHGRAGARPRRASDACATSVSASGRTACSK